MNPTERIDKRQLTFFLKYKDVQGYVGVGARGVAGLKYQSKLTESISFYVNPYYGFLVRGIDVGVTHKMSEYSAIKCEFNITDLARKMRTAIEYRLEKMFKLFLSADLTAYNFAICLGLRYNNFNIGLPIFSAPLGTNKAIVLLPVLALATVASFYWDKIMSRMFPKKAVRPGLTLNMKIEKRARELKLISARVRANFAEEGKEKGLIIKEAYYGSPDLIREMKKYQGAERVKVAMDEKNLGKILDVTDPLRFYVENSKLLLYKRSKKNLLGFYELDVNKIEVPHLVINYTYRGVPFEREFSDLDEVSIP